MPTLVPGPGQDYSDSCEMLICFAVRSCTGLLMPDHRVQEMMHLMVERIRSIAHSLSEKEIEHFIREILSADRIFIMGAGRSGLVAKAFAMRLMHLGLHSYVVGETITPALKPGDLLVVFSGSGKTKTIADIAETAKEIGGRISLITSNPDQNHQT